MRERPRRPEPHRKPHLLETIHQILEQILKVLKKLANHPPTPVHTPTLGGFIRSVHGRRLTVPENIPVPKLLDTEKINLSVMPRKADGHVDIAAVVSWVADGDVGAEPGTEPFEFTDPQNGDEVVTCPGNFNCYATTPGATGTGNVVVSAPGYEALTFGPIEYAAGVARSLNGSVGSPVSDL